MKLTQKVIVALPIRIGAYAILLTPLWGFVQPAKGDERAVDAPPQSVSFTQHVLPMLRKNCLACHHDKLAEGGLSLETVTKILEGGDSGPAINMEDAASSLLLGRARGAIDSIMPPEDNSADAVPLTEAELAILERWIAEGAADKAASETASIEWQRLPDQLNAVYSLAFAPEGNWMAVGRGNSVALIDGVTGQPTIHLEDPSLKPINGEIADPSAAPMAQIDFVNSLAIHPSGNWIASGGYRTVRIWRRQVEPLVEISPGSAEGDPKSALLLAVLAESSAEAVQVPVAQASTEQAAGAETVNLASGWDIGGSLRELVVSADGRFAVTVAIDGPVRLWNATEAKLLGELAIAGPEARIGSQLESDLNRQQEYVAYVSGLVPAAEALAKKEEEARVAAEEAETKQREDVAAKQTKVQEAETARKSVVDADPAPTDEAKAAAQKQVDEATQALAASEATLVATGQALAAAVDTRDRAAQALETLRQEVQREQDRLTAAQAARDAHAQTVQNLGQPTTVAISPDGSSVVCSYRGGYVAHFSTADGRLLDRFHSGSTVESDLRFLDGGWLVATEREGGKIYAWRLDRSWYLERTLGDIAGESPFADRVTALDFSPDGRHLVVGGGSPSRSGETHLIDVDSWNITAAWMDRHSDSVLCVRVSPDGRLLATCGADRQIHIIEFPSGEHRRTLEGHTHHVLGLDWQDNGRRLISVSADKTIKIWDMRSGEAERTIPPAGKEVTSISFAGSTARFVTTSGDGAVRLYNGDDGAVLRTFNPVTGFQYAVDVNAAGDRVVAGGQDGAVRLWDIEVPEPLHQIP